MPDAVNLPRLILGPLSGGRGFGVIARSPNLPIDEPAVTELSIFNHGLVFQVREGEVVHSLQPVPRAIGVQYLSTTRGHPAMGGNPVVVTSGILLDSTVRERLQGRADLLLGKWIEDTAELTDTRLIPSAHFEFPAVVDKAKGALKQLDAIAPLIGALPIELYDLPANHKSGERAALALIGAILAAAPAGRAGSLSWSTRPIGDLAWSVTATHKAWPEGPAPDQVVALRPTADGGIEVKSDPQALAVETLWSALLGGVARSRFGSPAHAERLDQFRHGPVAEGDAAQVARSRCANLLQQMATAYGPAGLAAWLQLLVDAAVAINNPPFSQALTNLVLRHVGDQAETRDWDDPAAAEAAFGQLRRELLAGAGQAQLRLLAERTEAVVGLAVADRTPLALWPQLGRAERCALVTRANVVTNLAELPGATLGEAAATLAAQIAEAGPAGSEAAGRVEKMLAAAAESQVAPLDPDFGTDCKALAQLCFNTSVPSELRARIRTHIALLLDRDSAIGDNKQMFAAEIASLGLRGFAERGAIGEVDPMVLVEGMLAFLRLKLRPIAQGMVGLSR